MEPLSKETASKYFYSSTTNMNSNLNLWDAEYNIDPKCFTYTWNNDNTVCANILPEKVMPKWTSKLENFNTEAKEVLDNINSKKEKKTSSKKLPKKERKDRFELLDFD